MVSVLILLAGALLVDFSSPFKRGAHVSVPKTKGQSGLAREASKLNALKKPKRRQSIAEIGSRQQNQCINNLIKEKDGSYDQNNSTFRPPAMCKTEFRVHYMNIEPYSNKEFKDLLKRTLQQCCGTEKVMRLKHTLRLVDADFVYPVFGDTRSELVYGFYFIPLIHPPGVFYVTLKKHFYLSHLVAQCLELWPLLVTCISLALAAGFVVWLLETRKNKKRFPRSFFRGWYEGIWFSFVFMTPVGFGNTAPKSIPGRLFSVVSILVGMFVFEILAAELTTIILQANTPEQASMMGAKVGVMSDRMYDSTIVTNNGGYRVEANNIGISEESSGDNQGEENIELEEFYKLVSELRAGRLDGFALDKHSYRNLREDFVNSNLTEGRNYDIGTLNFFLHSTIVTDIPHSGGDGAYGLLMKKKYHHDFFGPVFESSRLEFQLTLSKELHDSSKSITVSNNMNIYTEVLYENMLLICVSIGSIICFGVVFQIRRRQIKERKRKQQKRPEVVAI